MAMHTGSCLCGSVRYALASEPRAITHCHCRMCQKQHGAAFATYGSVPRSDLIYLSGEASLGAYNSSGSIVRKFCRRCGSSIEWTGSEGFPDWVSIALGTLDTPITPKVFRHAHLDARACWLAEALVDQR